MADFFDARSEGYEAHMARTVAAFDRFYASIASPIPETDEALKILDIGCGTGLALGPILRRAPNAMIMGIDISAGMLRRLRERYVGYAEQLTLVHGSYLEVPLGDSVYDYAVSVMTLHHLLPARKRELYRRVRSALKPNGAYIEGDWIVSSEEERRYLSAHDALAECLSREDEPWVDGSHHIDVPLTLETQKRLLREAGFTVVDVLWEADGNSVYVARTDPSASEATGSRADSSSGNR